MKKLWLISSLMLIGLTGCYVVSYGDHDDGYRRDRDYRGDSDHKRDHDDRDGGHGGTHGDRGGDH